MFPPSGIWTKKHNFTTFENFTRDGEPKMTEDAKKLDSWRWAEAGQIPLSWGAPFVHSEVVEEYRRLVTEDVRPNPLRAFPLAVQEAEKQIRYVMETALPQVFLDRLPHLLATLYEHGMRDASRDSDTAPECPDVEEARDTSELDARDILSEIGHWIRQYEDLNFAVNVPTTPEQQDDFNRKLSAHYESRAPRHPIRRHLDAVRSRQEVVRDAFEYRHGEQSAARVFGDA